MNEAKERLDSIRPGTVRLAPDARRLDARSLDILFRDARSQRGWTGRDVDENLLRELHGLAILGPTSMNCCPMRLVFVRSSTQKDRLLPAINEGNREKIRTAPVLVVIGYDLDFPKTLPILFPHRSVQHLFDDDPRYVEETAVRNGTLQGAYLMLAARSLGLDCGPISGFDRDAIDRLLFGGTRIRTNFLCGIGYGDPDRVFPRLPRPGFDDMCRIT